MSSINPRENMNVLYYYYALLENIMRRSIVSKIIWLRKLHRFIENWYGVLLFRLGLIDSVEIRFRNGERYRVYSVDEYHNIFKKHVIATMPR